MITSKLDSVLRITSPNIILGLPYICSSTSSPMFSAKYEFAATSLADPVFDDRRICNVHTVGQRRSKVHIFKKIFYRFIFSFDVGDYYFGDVKVSVLRKEIQNHGNHTYKKMINAF